MNRIKIFLAASLVLILSLALATPVLAQEAPAPPHQFWGAVNTGGSAAPNDTEVTASIDGVAITWNTTTTDGKYGYSPLFKIPSDNPDTAEKDGGSNGDLIVFTVGEEIAGQATFDSGGKTELPLSITGPAPDPLTAEAGGPYSGTTGASIALSGSASGGTTPYAYAWDLDDDGEYDDAFVANPPYSWATAGTYTVGLEVTDVSATDTDTATVTVTTPSPPPPPPPTIDTDLFGTEGSFETDSDGEIQETIEATSEDGVLTVTIPEGTIALLEDEPLETLEAAVDETPPEPPEDASIIGLAYDFGPDGATFDPSIALEYSYDPDALPEGVAEEDLVLAYYDESISEWVELECVVDTENNTITASVAHFTTFAIIGTVVSPGPAAFSLSSLSIQPAEIEPEESVTISVSVANTGGESGSHTVVLEIDGVEEAEETVTIAAGNSQTVSFSVTREEAGTYAVAVNGLSGSFTVVTPAKFNWPLIGGIIGGVLLVVGLFALFVVLRRRE